jgi:hypothetical protein
MLDSQSYRHRTSEIDVQLEHILIYLFSKLFLAVKPPIKEIPQGCTQGQVPEFKP